MTNQKKLTKTDSKGLEVSIQSNNEHELEVEKRRKRGAGSKKKCSDHGDWGIESKGDTKIKDNIKGGVGVIFK